MDWVKYTGRSGNGTTAIFGKGTVDQEAKQLALMYPDYEFRVALRDTFAIIEYRVKSQTEEARR